MNYEQPQVIEYLRDENRVLLQNVRGLTVADCKVPFTTGGDHAKLRKLESLPGELLLKPFALDILKERVASLYKGDS